MKTCYIFHDRRTFVDGDTELLTKWTRKLIEKGYKVIQPYFDIGSSGLNANELWFLAKHVELMSRADSVLFVGYSEESLIGEALSQIANLYDLEVITEESMSCL